MEITDKNIVVTGGGNGIGEALCRRFAADGARAITVVDVEHDAAHRVAEEVGGLAVVADLSSEQGNRAAVDAAEDAHGPIDLFCANAGVASAGGVDAPDVDWNRSWDINVMAHVWATRALVPRMLARGEGYLLHTASAAGLLTNLGAAPYSVTKHAVVALAEWLAITHGDQGLKVSCLCPQGVRTRMLFPDDANEADPGASVRMQGVVEPSDVAHAVVRGLRSGDFLILPHPEVLEFWRRKTADYDRWLSGMRRLQRRVAGG